jgi:hypothetical protein
MLTAVTAARTSSQREPGAHHEVCRHVGLADGRARPASWSMITRTGISVSQRWLSFPILAACMMVLSAQVSASKQAELEKRLSALEARLLSGPGATTAIRAPFEIVDKQGNPILGVSDGAFNSLPRKGRVQVARGTGDNFTIRVIRADGRLANWIGETNGGEGSMEVYDKEGKLRADLWGKNGVNVYNSASKNVIALGLGDDGNQGIWVRGDNGKVAAELREDKTGGGVVSVSDPSGRPRAQLYGQSGVAVYNASGKEVVGLGFNAANTERGLLLVRGLFQIADDDGVAMVEAGTSPTGVGVVRVGPMTKCVPLANLRVPDCIMGRHRP